MNLKNSSPLLSMVLFNLAAWCFFYVFLPRNLHSLKLTARSRKKYGWLEYTPVKLNIAGWKFHKIRPDVFPIGKKAGISLFWLCHRRGYYFPVLAYFQGVFVLVSWLC